MVKNEAVTEATLEAKEWEGELDDADLTAVSGGNITTDLEALGKNLGDYYSALGQGYSASGKGIGAAFNAAFNSNG